MENGNPTERKKWFPDIEALFKLLYYENVPPYLKVQDLCSEYMRKSGIFFFLVVGGGGYV